MSIFQESFQSYVDLQLKIREAILKHGNTNNRFGSANHLQITANSYGRLIAQIPTVRKTQTCNKQVFLYTWLSNIESLKFVVQQQARKLNFPLNTLLLSSIYS